MKHFARGNGNACKCQRRNCKAGFNIRSVIRERERERSKATAGERVGGRWKYKYSTQWQNFNWVLLGKCLLKYQTKRPSQGNEYSISGLVSVITLTTPYFYFIITVAQPPPPPSNTKWKPIKTISVKSKTEALATSEQIVQQAPCSDFPETLPSRELYFIKIELLNTAGKVRFYFYKWIFAYLWFWTWVWSLILTFY